MTWEAGSVTSAGCSSATSVPAHGRFPVNPACGCSQLRSQFTEQWDALLSGIFKPRLVLSIAAATPIFFRHCLPTGVLSAAIAVSSMTNRFFRSPSHRFGTALLVMLLKFALPYGQLPSCVESTCWVTLSRRHDNHLSLWSNGAASIYRQRYSDHCRPVLFARVHQLIADPVNPSPATRGHRRLACVSGIDDFPARV